MEKSGDDRTAYRNEGIEVPGAPSEAYPRKSGNPDDNVGNIKKGEAQEKVGCRC